jgi:palmitoyltransferase
MHYYYVVTVKPGFSGDLPSEPGTSFLWARKGNTKGKQKVLTGGVRWTSKGVKITPAGYTKCLKCAGTRPEVRIAMIKTL